MYLCGFEWVRNPRQKGTPSGSLESTEATLAHHTTIMPEVEHVNRNSLKQDGRTHLYYGRILLAALDKLVVREPRVFIAIHVSEYFFDSLEDSSQHVLMGTGDDE